MEAKKAKLEDTPVVSEFLDVFPKELYRLPPEKKEKKFKVYIHVVLGTQPISIPPYRMVPTKLRELKS